MTAKLPWTRAPQRRVFISYRRDDTRWVAGRLVDARHKPYFLAAAWAGTVGAMGSFLLLLPIDPPYEELSMMLGSSATILVMLVCLSLSGFRPRQ